MVVPLRIGGGSRLKILEALASGDAGRLDARSAPRGCTWTPGRHLDRRRGHRRLAGRSSATAATIRERRRRRPSAGRRAGAASATTGTAWRTSSNESGAVRCDRVQADRAEETCTPMNVVHLTASTFFGGPERQMLGLARGSGRRRPRPSFLSFPEGGRCRPFLDASASARVRGACALTHDTPHFRGRGPRDRRPPRARRGRRAVLPRLQGGPARPARRPAAGIPVVAVSRGWTGESFKVRALRGARPLPPALDGPRRLRLGGAGREGAAGRRAGGARRASSATPSTRAVRRPGPDATAPKLLRYLPRNRARVIVGAAGRLSPEKGFDVLVAAAAQVVRARRRRSASSSSATGRAGGRLQQRINARRAWRLGSSWRGFRADLDRFLPHLDLLVLPSYTEGLPNVVLEAFAAGVPVVATAVGGTPEVVEDGVERLPRAARRCRGAGRPHPRRRRRRSRTCATLGFKAGSASGRVHLRSPGGPLPRTASRTGPRGHARTPASGRPAAVARKSRNRTWLPRAPSRKRRHHASSDAGTPVARSRFAAPRFDAKSAGPCRPSAT